MEEEEGFVSVRPRRNLLKKIVGGTGSLYNYGVYKTYTQNDILIGTKYVFYHSIKTGGSWSKKEGTVKLLGVTLMYFISLFSLFKIEPLWTVCDGIS